MSTATSSEEILPAIGTFDDALFEARQPRPSTVNGTVSGIELHIGSPEIDAAQAIVIPIKYSKATMKARPPSLSKAWKPAMDLQAPPRVGNYPTQLGGPSSQLASSLAQQSQSMENPIAKSDLAAMISADVKHHSTYVIQRADGTGGGAEVGTQMSQSQVNWGNEGLEDTYPGDTQGGQEQEEAVAKEDIVKAWRFGSTWVPMEADTFEPLDTKKGVEILGFFPRIQVSVTMLGYLLELIVAGQAAFTDGGSSLCLA
jgi:ATP-dependent DNA helicase 2 subunit 2